MKFLPGKTIRDLLSPKKLFLLIGPQKPCIFLNYSLKGPSNIVITLVKTRYGDGPELHYHLHATEHFYVIKGKYQITYGKNLDRVKNGDMDKVYINPGDLIQIQPKMIRSFTQISHDEGMLLPIVLGTNDERKDIMFPTPILTKIKQNLKAMFSLNSIVTHMFFVVKERGKI